MHPCEFADKRPCKLNNINVCKFFSVSSKSHNDYLQFSINKLIKEGVKVNAIEVPNNIGVKSPNSYTPPSDQRHQNPPLIASVWAISKIR